ncbi:spore cortex biosynthesis protein YabQ [Heliorestis convoluta]|uniref:Spore cortex biosynthesis protein YabQ n=1 Tax=Heliorestis convoluta TaxID=356322 RepID=A0A5Q2N892_9FIRM|nr:spore cortex biosynthesis protein YabQ [Heliorestis convoluta]QGG48715.1 Spore cortex biosynthesis protein YabQ [Heliorestis convoluta]
MTPLAQQIYDFLLSSVGGVIIGAGFDLYRTLIRVGYRRWWVALADVIIWLMGALLFFLLLFWGNWGEIRAYVFLGLATGLLLYFRYLSGEVRAFWEGMLELILHILRTLFYVLTFPFIYLYQLLVRVVRYLLKKSHAFWQWYLRRWGRPIGSMAKKIRGRWRNFWRTCRQKLGRWRRRPPADPPSMG